MGQPGDTVFVLGNDFRPTWSSSEDGLLLGRRLEDWESGTLSEMIHPDDRAWILTERQEILAAPTAAFRGRVRLKGTDGTHSPVLLMATNHFDRPEINGIVVSLRPIARAFPVFPDEGNDEQSGAIAVHIEQMDRLTTEIRSSVDTITGSADALSNDPSLEPTQRMHAATISSATQAVGEFLQDVDHLSRASADMMALDPVVFSPSRIVDGVAATFEPMCRRNELTLALRYAADLPDRVKGDPIRLGRVLQHLISNAATSAPEGSVCVEARATDNGKIRFWVSDNGKAMPAEIQDSTITPWPTDDQHRPGTELRLDIASQVVELMGSSLCVQTDDEGTAFWFDVIFGHARRIEDRPTQPPAPVAGAAGHVLVVDDSEVNRLLATSQLERLGYTFATAEGGQEALDLLANGTFDAVLMDWHMPGMDGLDATRQWRANNDPDRRLPIISMTASAMAGDRERCIEAGASDYLSKPVSITDLGSMLSRWTGTREPIDAPDPVRPDSSSKISSLVADLGDVGVVCAIVSAYLDMVPQYRDNASTALDQGDRGTVRRCAHTLKSTALMLGIDELAEACITLEAAAATDTADLATPLAEFVRCCTEAEVVLVDIAGELETLSGTPQSVMEREPR